MGSVPACNVVAHLCDGYTTLMSVIALFATMWTCLRSTEEVVKDVLLLKEKVLRSPFIDVYSYGVWDIIFTITCSIDRFHILWTVNCDILA